MSDKSSVSTVSFCPKTQAVIRHKGYKVENKLGQGAYGVVFKATNVRTGQLSAVKVIELTSMSERSRAKFLPREIQTLINCRHENLIQVYDIFRAASKMFIFMEFAGNGDIAGYAKKHNGIKESLTCQWFWQATQGLAFLHINLSTAHRDIKLDNVLLDQEWVAKMTDFGFAKNFDVDNMVPSTTFCGTVPYECPQILEHKPYNAFKADIWSMGVTLFIMLHNRFPFQYKDRKEMIRQVKDYPKFLRSRYVRQDLPSSAGRLLEVMLNPDEERRATVQDILRSSYLRSKLPK